MLCVCRTVSFAQTTSADPLESMPIRVGPLGLTPTLTIANFGIDSNIFNEPTDPQEDFTTTITPRLQARLRSGRVLLSGAVATGFVYYHTFDDERSIDYTTDGRVDLDLGWFRPYALALLNDTRERLNAEIDVRAPRTQTTLAAGTRVTLSSKTGLVFEARRAGLEFAEGYSFEGIPLSRTLNSTTRLFEGGMEFFLTPLTTLSVTASRQEDRFDSSPERNSNTLKILPTLRMESPAIIQGTLAVGYRHFEPLSSELPDYSGLVAQGSLSHVFAERTKVDFSVSRDVQYSFEVTEPYYLTTAFRLTVTYQLSEPFDLKATGGRDRLEYRADESILDIAAVDDRIDRVDVVGAGVGYRFRPNLRVGFDVEYARRLSDLAERQYDRTRVFGSLTYGF
jgi:hypothetical protein